MTDETNLAVDVSEPVQNSVSNDANNSSSNVNSTSQTGGKLFTQAEIDDIAGRAREAGRQKGYESAKRENNPYPNQTQNIPDSNNEDRLRKFAEDAIQKRITDFERQSQMTQVSKTASEIMEKVNSSKDEFPELGAAMTDTRWNESRGLADVALLAHQMGENTSAILNEIIVNNPHKLVTLANLASVNPTAARKQIESLSQSITQNRDANNRPTAEKPLSQIKPSNTGTGNGSKSKTVGDLRRLDFLRG